MYIVLKFAIASLVLLFWTDGNFCFTNRLHFLPEQLLTPGFFDEISTTF